MGANRDYGILSRRGRVTCIPRRKISVEDLGEVGNIRVFFLGKLHILPGEFVVMHECHVSSFLVLATSQKLALVTL